MMHEEYRVERCDCRLAHLSTIAADPAVNVVVNVLER